MSDNEEIKQDKDAVTGFLNEFKETALLGAGLLDGQALEALVRLKAYIWQSEFGDLLKTFDYTQLAPFTYDKFWIESEEEAKKNKRDRLNLLDAWRNHLEGLEADKLDVRKKNLRAALLMRTEEILPPTIDGTHRHHPAAATGSSSKGHNGARPASTSDNPSLNVADVSSVPGIYHPFYAESAAFGFVGGGLAGALYPVAAGMLLGSASKLAICTTLGVLGFPIAGIVAGVGAGIITSAFKNRASIAQDMKIANLEGKNQFGAFARGVAQSCNWKQLALSAAFGAAGGLGSGLLTDLFSGSECVVDKARDIFDTVGLSDWDGTQALLDEKENLAAQVNLLRTANDNFGQQFSDLNAKITDLNEQIDALTQTNGSQTATISGLQRQIADLQSAASTPPSVSAPEIAVEAPAPDWSSWVNGEAPGPDASSWINAETSAPIEVTSAPDASAWINESSAPALDVDSMDCPDYISDCPESGSLSIQETINGDAVPDVAPPADTVLHAENSSVTVASGDTLTDIIEKQYGVDELSLTDSDADGIRDFDEIMAAVANANGLEGNQANWLKVNWELSMPEVTVADASANIDRAALDANWRAGDVVFSDVPQLKAA